MTQISKIKLLVLGSRGVGKSAVVVRFLTKRYIGEYQSNIDILYKKDYRADDITASLEILDISGKQKYSCRELEENILWANGFVVLYDISDRDSLIEAQVYLETINSIRSIAQTPIILIANKRDLEAGREVPISDGRNLAVQFGGQFFEVSAADTYIGVCVSFDAIIREIFLKRSGRASQPQCNSNSTSHKKLSIVTVSKVFGAVFGRNSSDGNFYYPDMSCSSIDMSTCSDNSKTRRSPSLLGSRSFCKAKKSKSATMIRVTRKQSQPILSV
ncbi:ras-related and estrogen-regulated growth inhibitor-like protein [Brevipalpus obovatus]|uniref:ras-related and estrogen-regulated growth inhibitor-like protein n=1 Tax=Brevipalpus obovatus TaxID=246614 RepID=UPI003D9E9988